MDNPEEILHSLEEFSKLKPKDIPRELEEYLCFVAKTGDPVYQWSIIKSLFREKLINVITEFYEACPTVEIPPCPNVELFNYDSMKNFILEKLDTFAAAPFTVQRICELLTTPRKEYNRIDKYMRALEKNILVVSTTEPGNRRNNENGEGIVNGLESEHLNEANNPSNDINVEEMDDTPSWPRGLHPDTSSNYNSESSSIIIEPPSQNNSQETFVSESRNSDSTPCSSSADTVITCRSSDQQPYVSIEPVASDSCSRQDTVQDSDVTVTITAIPPTTPNRRSSDETVASSDPCTTEPSDSTQEIDNEQKVESTKLELEEIKETLTIVENKESADSTTVLQETTNVPPKEADEDSQVASTSSETTSSDNSSPETLRTEENNIESDPTESNVPDKETISTAEVIESSENVCADTTKLIEEEAEESSTSVLFKNNDAIAKEDVISSSDEVVNEPSSAEPPTEENTESKEDCEKNEPEVTIESPEAQADTSEHLEKVPGVSVSIDDSDSSSNDQSEPCPMDVDDTTQDTAILVPNVTDDSN